jgi:hypothetical protein
MMDMRDASLCLAEVVPTAVVSRFFRLFLREYGLALI